MSRYVVLLVLLSALLSWGYSDKVSPQSDELSSVETVSDSYQGEIVTSEIVEVLEQFQMGLEVQEEFAILASCLSGASSEARNVTYIFSQYNKEGLNVSWSWYGPVHQFFMS